MFIIENVLTHSRTGFQKACFFAFRFLHVTDLYDVLKKGHAASQKMEIDN